MCICLFQVIKENGGLSKLVAYITDTQPPEEEEKSKGKGKDKGAASRAGKKGKGGDDGRCPYLYNINITLMALFFDHVYCAFR